MGFSIPDISCYLPNEIREQIDYLKKGDILITQASVNKFIESELKKMNEKK